MKEEIKANIIKSIECKENLLKDELIVETIEKVCKEIINAYKNNHRVYIMGNGGSAADAQHFAAELVGRYLLERNAWPAQAFTTDTSIITAIGNDYGYDEIFTRQVEAMVQKGDIVIGITTSGNSNNIALALEKSKRLGAKTIGLLGKTGGRCKELCDYPIIVRWDRTPNIQESHIMIIHIICELVEKELKVNGK